MNNKNVIALPASANFTAEQALQSALSYQDLGVGLTDVMIVGYDQQGGVVIRSSHMTCAEALFLLEKAKQWALTGGNP